MELKEQVKSKGGNKMKMNLTGAIEILKLHKHTTDKFKHSIGDAYVSEAIDTVIAELEKPLPTDEELKERGNLTYRVLLRALNLKFEKGKVTFSEKELRHWFETGQHLKEWKEWDTL